MQKGKRRRSIAPYLNPFLYFCRRNMYLFNPDNDLALANFSATYTPPASALKIGEDLAALPLWYAPEGERIIANPQRNFSYLAAQQQSFAFSHKFISPSESLAPYADENLTPWGWNPALRKRMRDKGLEENRLPSISYLKELREYANRKNAVKMLRELKAAEANFCGESHHFDNISDVLNYLRQAKGDCVLKMPNSGSGKGLVWIKGQITDKQTDWCRRVIREQGGVIAEPVWNKVQDFAMEFRVGNGKAYFHGYSLFHAAASGAYTGNYLLSDEDIQRVLAKKGVSIDLQQKLQQFYTEKLPLYFPDYNGYVGVDMMICATHKGLQLHPCVEMNVRMNMGVVAHTFRERFVANHAVGIFKVDYFKQKGAALQFCQNQLPATIIDGKINEGFLNLTAIDVDTHYVAYVHLKNSRNEKHSLRELTDLFF